MAFTQLNDDLNIIAKLDDEPNDVGGLTAAELKDKFDEAGVAIQRYINETLLPELKAYTAAAAIGAVMNGEAVTLQAALDILREASVKSGNVPVGGYTGDILRKKSDDVYDLQWAQMVSRFDFAVSDWIVSESGGYTITVPQGVHMRGNKAYGCLIRHNVDGVYKTNTWAAVGTQNYLDEETGDIILSSGDAYDGSAMFFDEGA